MMVLLLLLAGLAGAVAFASFIWLAIVAFRKHVLWGLAVLFLPLAPIVFAVMNWHESKKPFLINLGSSVATFLFFFGAGGAAFMMAANMNPDAMAIADPSFTVTPAEDSAGWDPAYAVTAADPEGGHVPQDRESTASDRRLDPGPVVTLEPSSPGLETAQAGMATPNRRPRRSPGSEIQPNEIDETYVGISFRVASTDGLNTRAKLAAVSPTTLTFERDVGLGTVTFDLSRNEVESLYVER